MADTELLAAPIAINGQRFGTLFVAGSITREPFPPEALDLVASLTRYVAGFYGRALLLHEARRNASRLVLQHAIDAALLEGSSLQQLGERILPNLRELVGADVSALTRVHGDSGEVEILVNDPLPAGVGGVAAGSRHAVPPGTISALAVEGARIDITDVDILPQEEGPLALIRSVGLRSLLQEPMIVRGAVVGHLTLAAGRPDAFGPQDRELISDVAAQLAIALQQADLRAAVIKAEARYQELVERLPAVVYVDSLDGTAAHYVSPQVERMLGYEAADWLSDPARRLLAVHPEDRDRLEAELHAFRAYQQPTQVEYRFVTGNGREVWVRDEILPVEDLGTGQRLAQGIIFDITDAKRLEEQSRRGQKLEAVGLLAGAVAHDFNNLLTAIGGYSGLLLRDSSPFDPRRADLLAIQDATARATRLTRQLLAFGRRQPLEPVVLDLVASVETIGDLLRQLVGESIELRIRADPGPVSVLADASQLEQVVVNLVVNARDALAGHGTIELDVGFWHASPMEAAQRGHDPGAWAQLTVHDDGVGMDAQTQARIFEPFFSTKPLGEGTGLGLATVHGIVGQFGGSIDLQSAPGAGTTFRILLPIAVGAGDQGSVAAEGPPKVPLSSAGGTVLLVEDDAAVRIFAARALTAAGYQVIAAGSGDAALAAVIGDGPIVAVVTDAMMPGMSGAQLVARLRLDRPMVPVLFISGHTGELAGVPAGDRPLFKPFGPEELVAAVGTVIASAAAA